MTGLAQADPALQDQTARLRAALGARSIVLVGMMGAGKSSIGRRLGRVLGLPFLDVDVEIEKAAGMSVAEIFEHDGEAAFRAGEARIIARLLRDGPVVMATGGGAWINAGTRALVAERGVSVWLRAEPEILIRRVRRRNDRPLLRTSDPEATLRALLKEREPLYAAADLTVHSRDVTQDAMAQDIVAALEHHLRERHAAELR